MNKQTKTPPTNNDFTYLVIGGRKWSKNIFSKVIKFFPGRWVYIDSSQKFNLDIVKRYNPRYIFLIHWSMKVHEEIFSNFECINFHITDVPYGRGGSPLQNLITRGHKKTKISALQVTPQFDAGPVYLKEDLSLTGSAQEIYYRTSNTIAKMVKKIIDTNPQPTPQSGKPIIFKRRTPEQSEIPQLDSLASLYDFIRMLDAEGYPRAFIHYKDFVIEFCNAKLKDNTIDAYVNIRKETEI